MINGLVFFRIFLNIVEGLGLMVGEVGCVGRFIVIIDNFIKGLLSVCISCLVVFILVFYVKSVKKDYFIEYNVLYIFMEFGVYEVFIKWGDMLIIGSFFKVFINNVLEDGVSGMFCGKVDLGGCGRIWVYYVVMLINLKVCRDNEMLEKFLKVKGILSCFDFDFWIVFDVGMSKVERDKVFFKVGICNIFMVFVNDVFIGGYEDVIIMDK